MKKNNQQVWHVASWVVIMLAGVIMVDGCSKATRAASQQQQADADFAAGRYDKAEIGYLNVLKLMPTNVVAFRNLGLMAMEQGSVPRAYAALSKAKALDPTDLLVRNALGILLFANGEAEKARTEALYVAERQPTNQEAVVLFANASLATNKPPEIRAALQRLRPANTEPTSFVLASALLQTRENDVPGAERTLRQALQVAPDSALAHFMLASLLWSQKRLPEADVEFKKASDLAPVRSSRRMRYVEFKLATGDAAGGRRILQEALDKAPDYLDAGIRLAELSLQEGKADEALSLLQKVLARDQANQLALLLSAKAYVAKAEPAKALAYVEGAAKVSPNAPLVQYELARVQLANNDVPKAMASLQKATTLATNYLDPILLLAELLIRRGESAEAITRLNRASALWSNNVTAQLLMATAYRARGDLPKALQSYNKAAQLVPTNSEPVFLAGLTLRQQTNNAAARRSFEQALALQPNFLPALEQLIGMDVADRDFDAALKRTVAEAARLPKAPSPHVLAAQVHLARKDLPKAEEELKKALELAPDFRPAQMMMANILVATGRGKLAIERLESVAAKNTNDLSPLLEVALIHTASTNYTAARDTYERILVAKPNAALVLNNLADLYSRQLGNLPRALELARKARQWAPSDPAADALVPATADTLGWILYQQGDYSQAIGFLKESAAKLTHEALVFYHLGMTHYMLDEEAPAKLALQTALDLNRDFPGSTEASDRLKVLTLDGATADVAAKADLERRRTASPDDPIVLSRLAAVYQREGTMEKAAAAYEQALKRNPNSVPLLMSLAKLHAGPLKQPAKALDLARKARNLAPENEEVARILGPLALQSGDYSWALSLLEESARVQPDSSLLLDLALAQFGVGQVQNSLASVQKSVALGTNFARSGEAQRMRNLLGVVLQPETARPSQQMIRDIVAKEPNYLPALAAAARLEEQLSDYTHARDRWEAILQRAPRFTLAQKQLALLYLERLNDPNKAYEFASKAREAFPDDPLLARTLGILCYDLKKDYSRAAQLLTSATQAPTTDGEALYYLGMAHYQLKRPELARPELTKALSLRLPAAMTNECRRVLDGLK